MSGIIIRILSPILIGAILFLLFKLVKRHNNKEEQISKDKNRIVVHLPKAYLIIGIICLFCFVGFIIFSLVSPIVVPRDFAKTLPANVIFIIFISMFVLIIESTIVWRIEVFTDKDYFVYRAIWGRKKTIKYKDCINYTTGRGPFTLKTQKSTYRIDPLCTNLDYFERELNRHNIRHCKKY